MTDRPPSVPGGAPSDGAAADPEDRVLVRRALDGQSEAFGQLFDRYVRLVHSVCYDTTASTEDARDLVQDVFLRSYRNLEQLREPDRFANWLLAIAHRTCRDWIRRRVRDRHEFTALDPSGEVDPPEIEGDEELVLLQRGMQKLPDNERLALHLFYLEDQPVEAARRVLGLSRSGFYRVLERARERLRDILEP